ncbi:MAG: DUF2784 domain-containing protein [Burkholderiales bacterium]|nr:DUF2784 domain-containing protein [Burkholderiales bacterium]
MLADLVLVLHFCVAGFLVLGLILVWIGALAGWVWVRNPWFRYLHLAAIACVALEALAGLMCPLTVWEDALRGGARPESFVGRWVARLLYYDAPEWVFTLLYASWATAALVTLWLIPVHKK